MNSFNPAHPNASSIDLAHLPAGWIEATYGNRNGALFCPGWDKITASAHEAVRFFYKNDSSAILSFVPGKDVLYFRHGGAIYRCCEPPTSRV